MRIQIYNIVGEKLDFVEKYHHISGYHRIHWDIRNAAPGIYIYRSKRIAADGRNTFKFNKLVIVK